MRPIHLAMLVALVTTVSAGCSGPTLPLSAQAGSSIAIPLTGEAMEHVDIGYGSALVEDHQRGELVFRLQGTEEELHTRATSAVTLGRSTVDGGRVQIVSLVDIPETSPVGTFAIDVVRRFRDASGVLQESPVPYAGTISILPHALDVDCDQTVDFVGAPTPWELLFADGTTLGLVDFASSDLVQHPELVLILDKQVHAIEIDLAYPQNVIAIEEVTASPGASRRQKISWWDETAPGQASVAMLGRSSFGSVAVAFSLVDGESQILDPATVSVTIRSATDANGSELATAVTQTFIR